MSKKNKGTKQSGVHQEVKNEGQFMVANGLQEAVLGFDPTNGAQLSQADTLFRNNRWYLISNMRQLLSEMYVEHGLIQAVINVPVDDGLRGGVTITTNQLEASDIKDLEATIEKNEDLGQVNQALRWNRLYGGAGIIIITDQPSDEPLDLKALKDSPLEFRAVDMWELFYDKQNVEDGVMDDQLQLNERGEHYNYYGKKVHKSRIIRMEGMQAPSFIRPRLRGWGFSVVESVVRSINQYLKSTDLGFEVLDEFKLDIYLMKDLLNTLMQPDGTNMVQKRVQLANQQKNFQNAVVLDAEDQYEQKQLSFSGLAETMAGIRMQLAADLRMPMTKLFGISAAGFNSGEDDIENYNGMVEGQVRDKCKFEIIKIIELRCLQQFGFVPEDLEIEFESLRILKSTEEEEVKDRQFTRVLQARQIGEITSEEFRDACNQSNLLPIQLEELDGLEIEPPKTTELLTEPKGEE